MQSRIPELADTSMEAMGQWFSMMADCQLIFHPEDPAESIVSFETGDPVFSQAEAGKLRGIIGGFFERFGDVQVNDAAYPHFMRAAGMPC